MVFFTAEIFHQKNVIAFSRALKNGLHRFVGLRFRISSKSPISVILRALPGKSKGSVRPPELTSLSLFLFLTVNSIFPAMINYHDKVFRPVQNSENGETSAETIFRYVQKGNILTSSYEGGKILSGQLIGLVDEEGVIEMRYHQVNTANELMTGICGSIPEILPNGKIRLHETWQWTSGDLSKGNSILEEL